MKQLFLTVSLVLFFLPLFSQSIQVLDSFAHPESVLPWGKNLLVSNIGSKLEPTAKDADGSITLLTGDGHRLEERFLPQGNDTLHAPKGMAMIGNTLYVADVDRIVGFDLKSRRKTWELSLAGTSAFLNDLVRINDQFLAVSATDVHKLFLIDVTVKSFQEMPLTATIKGPNGLVYDADHKKLFVAGWGENNQPNGALFEVDLGNLFFTRQLSERPGFYDGMALSSTLLVVSDWVDFDNSGVVLLVDKTSGVSRPLSLPFQPGGPADLCFDEKARVLWVPAMLEGRVYRISLDVNRPASFVKN